TPVRIHNTTMNFQADEVIMTGTEDRGAHGDLNFPSAPRVARFLGGATVVAVLALITILSSLLPDVTAAQAQVRSSLVTLSSGRAYHKWSDHPDDPNSWSSWTDLGAPGGYALIGAPAMVSDGIGRLNVFAWSADSHSLWQQQLLYNDSG